jgi:hypothetical protein
LLFSLKTCSWSETDLRRCFLNALHKSMVPLAFSLASLVALALGEQNSGIRARATPL